MFKGQSGPNIYNLLRVYCLKLLCSYIIIISTNAVTHTLLAILQGAETPTQINSNGLQMIIVILTIAIYINK